MPSTHSILTTLHICFPVLYIDAVELEKVSKYQFEELCIIQTVIASEAKQSHAPVILNEIVTSFPSSRSPVHNYAKVYL